jgi:hypothetical protein
VIRPLLEAASPQVVVEIGVDVGHTTAPLLELASERGFLVHGIDPAPGPGFDELQSRFGDSLRFHRGTSLEELPLIRDVDAAIIDGDHNWYTVHNELGLLARPVADGRPFPLTFVHDVGWPYARRDLYYDPERIPPEHRHPYDRAAIVPGSTELSKTEGLNRGLFNAIAEGGPRSGVRTAVEDFLSESGLPIRFSVTEGFQGLGILAWEPALASNRALADALAHLDSPQWLREHCARLEDARVRLRARLESRARRNT